MRQCNVLRENYGIKRLGPLLEWLAGVWADANRSSHLSQ